MRRLVSSMRCPISVTINVTTSATTALQRLAARPPEHTIRHHPLTSRAMRTVIELPEEQLRRLADVCRREGVSRAEQPVVKVPAAFERRCIPPDGVVRRLRMPNMRPPHALSAGRLAALGAPRGSTTGCEVIRRAVADYLDARHVRDRDDVFGIWRDRNLDGLQYERHRRREWP